MSQRQFPFSPQILLVEDNISLARCLNQFLQDHGYETILARNLSEGFERLDEHRPWLCLLDLNLPDGSGLELLNNIALYGHPCRVIVMTAFDLEHLRPANASKVLAGWMNKPVDPAKLMAMVQEEESRLYDTIPDASRTCPCG